MKLLIYLDQALFFGEVLTNGIYFVQYALLVGGDATKNVNGETPENFSLFHDFLPLFREKL